MSRYIGRRAVRRRWRPGLEPLEDRCVPATLFTVTTTLDNGNNVSPTPGSLRAAVVGANAAASALIQFNIAPGGAQVIEPPFPLPALTSPTTIDGTSQPGYAGTPLIALDGRFMSGVFAGLEVDGGSSTITGLVITNWTGAGITFNNNGGDVVTACWIGTDPTGLQAAGNSDGIDVSTPFITIGGTAAGAGNVISGNRSDGILLQGEGATTLVVGNLIGPDRTGLGSLGNANYDVEVLTGGNTIGGTTAAARNVITGGEVGGIGFTGNSADSNLVQGNYVGVGTDGVTALGNDVGIDVVRGNGQTIGGAAVGAGNVIAASFGQQINLGTSNNTVEGNFVGTDATETYKLGNSSGVAGIEVFGNGNVVGDVVPGAGNVIAFSGGPAVNVDGLVGNSVRGNSMFLNRGPGINLGDSANSSQASPDLIAITVNGGSLTVSYDVPTSRAATDPISVDFYVRDPESSFDSPEGVTYLGSASYTQGSGTQTFTAGDVPIPPGGQVVATATDAAGNTSFFAGPAVASGSAYEWTGNGVLTGGPDPSWTNPDNWQRVAGPGHTIDYPQAADDIALFDQFADQLTPTIPTGVTILVGEIDFTSGSSYTIQGPGTLAFATGGGNAHVIDTSPHAAQTISAAVVLDSSLDASITSTNLLTFSGLITPAPSTVLSDVNGGPLALTGTIGVPAGQTFTLNNPLPGSSAGYAAGVNLGSGASLLISTAVNSTVFYSGAISGPGNFIKLGPGKVVLDTEINNTYTGSTAVRAGELEVDDVQPSSPVYVTNTGLLTGRGTVGSITTGSAPANLPAIRPLDAVTVGVNSVTMSLNPVGPTTFNFTVTLSAASSGAVSVSYATSSPPASSLPPGTSSAPTTDFDVTSGTITIAAGQTTATVQISAYADSTGGPEAFQIVLSNATGATISSGTGLGTINTALPTLSVAGTTTAVSPTGSTTLNFPVSLSAASGSEVTVAYTLSSYPSTISFPLPSLSGVTSASVSALTSTGGRLLIAANSSGGTISIPVSVASNITASQAFILTLSSPSNAVLPSATSEAVGLVTPAGLPEVSVSPAFVLASRTGTTTMTFTVTLSSALTSALTVNYKTVDQTSSFFSSGGPVPAKSVTNVRGQTTDYKSASSGSVTLAAGATSQTFTVTVNSSTNFVQNGKYFDVQLSLPTSSTSLASLGVGTALGTILYPTAQQSDGVQPDPNDLPAVLTAAGNVTFDPHSYLNILIDGPSPGNGSGFTGYSQLVVTTGHTVSLGGAQLNVILNLDAYISQTGGPPAVGTQYTIVNNQGSSAVSGTFAGLPEGQVFSVDNIFFQITYQGNDGNDVVLTVVPAPVTISGPTTGMVNQSLGYTLSGLPSGNYTVNWGDGSPTQTVGGSGNQSASHTFPAAGVLTVQVWGVTGGIAGVVTQYQVTITGVVVTGESVRWGTAGNVALQTAADGVRLLPAGRNTDLPWLNINRVAITLSSAPPSLSSGDISVVGVVGGNYGSVTITGSGTSYLLTFARPISVADRVTITIGNAGITTFTGRLDVLPGDVNDDGQVNSQDAVLARNSWLGVNGAGYNIFADILGAGVVDGNSYNAIRARIGTHLP